MNLIHFHVDQHDVGYLPNDEPAAYESIDGALEAVWWMANEHIEYCSQADPKEPVRGQIGVKELWTYAMEIEDVQNQVDSFKMKIMEDPEYTGELAKNGLLIALDAGIAVIELSPCVEEECQEYREEWIE